MVSKVGKEEDEKKARHLAVLISHGCQTWHVYLKQRYVQHSRNSLGCAHAVRVLRSRLPTFVGPLAKLEREYYFKRAACCENARKNCEFRFEPLLFVLPLFSSLLHRFPKYLHLVKFSLSLLLIYNNNPREWMFERILASLKLFQLFLNLIQFLRKLVLRITDRWNYCRNRRIN